ncbi:MAG: isocitrate lyase/PEP mutase family protein, partial [Bauldia sp.]
MTPQSTSRLAEIFAERRATLVPGAFNALSARVIADLGYEAVYVTGAGVTNGLLGVPDIGLITVTELAGTVAAIRDAVDLPLIVDADTGFGNAVNTVRTVRTLERAGADAIQIEDQVFPKKCGHFSGKDVVGVGEIVSKIKAAVDTRDRLLVVARTDARAIRG